jgi:hypothetical protein
MSFGSTLAHYAGKVAAPVLDANAAVNSFFGDQDAATKSRQMADAIASPNQVFTGGVGSVLDSNKTSFSPVQPIAPVTNNTTQSGGGGNATAPGGAYNADAAAKAAQDASDMAYIDDQASQLRDFLERTGSQLQNGLTQLGYDYNKTKGRADEDRATTSQKYDTQTQDTTLAKDASLNKARTSGRNLAAGVRGVISRAAGGGSSAMDVAGKAVTDKVSNDTTDIQTTFGRNFRDLDVAKKDAETQFDRQAQDLEDQRKQKESGLREGVENSRITAEGSLADLARQKASLQGGGYSTIRAASAPLQTSIANRQATIDSLFKQFSSPYSLTTVNTQAPQLADYTTRAANVQTGQPVAPTDPSLIAPWLKKQQEDDQLLAV